MFYAFLPPLGSIYIARASELDKNDVYKGFLLAFLFILLSRIGNSGERVVIEPDYGHFDYNSEDLELLARLIHGEARGEPYEGQVAVGAVVLNRVKSPGFPNTIREVIFQKNQFSAVSDGQFYLEPNETAYRAARDALSGRDPSLGALFFYNPKTAKTLYWLSTRETTVVIGNHVFAK
ncbi:MAG: cell wall hydrolase [Halanaerobiales bacterium]